MKEEIMKKWFLLYTSQRWPIKNLSKEEKWELLEMMFEYNTTGIINKSPSNTVTVIFEFLKIQFDIDGDKYNKICIRNKENIKKRRDWNTTGKTGIPKNTRNTNNDVNKDEEEDVNKDIKENNKNKYLGVFENFWKIYPIKKWKSEAYTAWKNAIKNTDPETIIKWAQDYASFCNATGTDKIKWAQWRINGKRREDELSIPWTDKDKALIEWRAKRDKAKIRQQSTFIWSLLGDEDTV